MLTPQHHFLNLARLMRPHQWVKNLFVFAGLLFSRQWTQLDTLASVCQLFIAFCLTSSSVYILNDWLDRREDELNPKKSSRPLASGSVTGTQALALGLSCWIASLLIALEVSVLAVAMILFYNLINVAYSFRLKRVPVVDVFIIAIGFVIRLLAGTWAVGIGPTHWFLLTGFFLALSLAISKRRSEALMQTSQQRQVLSEYSVALLDTFLAIAVTATLMTYSLFATSAESIARHGQKLWMTVPIVVFALLRNLYQVHRGQAEDFAKDLLKDAWIVGSVIAWLLIFLIPSP